MTMTQTTIAVRLPRRLARKKKQLAKALFGVAE
jgi:hypothetical protein